MSSPSEILSLPPARPASQNAAIEMIRNLLRNRSAVIGLVVIGFLICCAIFAPQIATYDPIQSMIGQPGETGRLPGKPPCVPLFGCSDPGHYFGLDLNGRDIYSRIIYGTRTSLIVGFSSVSIAVIIGTLIGLVSGYVGGWVDNLLMRLMDVILAFPSLLLAITIVTIFGPGLENALLAIALVSIPVYARLIRASVLSVKEMEYIMAVRSIGAKPARILFLHIFPNAVTPVIVQATLGIGTAVLDAAALAYLGLGARPPTPEWGQMLSEARAYIFTAPHMVFFPGIAIMITVLGFNLFGDGLRDALDPRLVRS
ncbi:MAG TPA: ABC transporter permease [Aggregatilineales bacterium]|nr:ABC transporter permease [Aggregatilineales bacterium]